MGRGREEDKRVEKRKWTGSREIKRHIVEFSFSQIVKKKERRDTRCTPTCSFRVT